MKTLIKAAIRIILAFKIYGVAVSVISEIIAMTYPYPGVPEAYRTPWYYYAEVFGMNFLVLVVLALFWISLGFGPLI